MFPIINVIWKDIIWQSIVVLSFPIFFYTVSESLYCYKVLCINKMIICIYSHFPHCEYNTLNGFYYIVNTIRIDRFFIFNLLKLFQNNRHFFTRCGFDWVELKVNVVFTESKQSRGLRQMWNYWITDEFTFYNKFPHPHTETCFKVRVFSPFLD